MTIVQFNLFIFELQIVQLVIEFFSPILHNYTEQLLGSVAVVWSDRYVTVWYHNVFSLIEVIMAITLTFDFGLSDKLLSFPTPCTAFGTLVGFLQGIMT